MIAVRINSWLILSRYYCFKVGHLSMSRSVLKFSLYKKFSGLLSIVQLSRFCRLLSQATTSKWYHMLPYFVNTFLISFFIFFSGSFQPSGLDRLKIHHVSAVELYNSIFHFQCQEVCPTFLPKNCSQFHNRIILIDRLQNCIRLNHPIHFLSKGCRIQKRNNHKYGPDDDLIKDGK